MKKFLPKKNFTRTLLVGLVFLLLGASELKAQSYEDCNSPSCSANDFRLDSVWLASDVSGTKLSESFCEDNGYTPQDVYLFTQFAIAGATRYSLHVYFDLVVTNNGEVISVTPFDSCYFFKQQVPEGLPINLTMLNWQCGDAVSIKNVYLTWQSNSNSDDCGCGLNSKCSYNADFIDIDAPLNGSFEYSACNNGANGIDAEFTAYANGGSGNYSYSWDFDGDGVYDATDLTTTSTNHSYSSVGPYNISLQIFDGTTTTVVNYGSIEMPAELSISNTSVNNLCDGTLGSIDLTINGGTPAYTINWTGPNGFSSSTEDISNLAAGTYNITVTDAFNCIAQSAIDIIEEDCCSINCSANPDITNISVQCSDDVPDPLTTITELEAVGFSFSECDATIGIVISSTDNSNDLSCPETITRTYKFWYDKNNNGIEEELDDIIVECDQTITIDDTTAPVVDNTAGDLDVTLQCSDASGIADALAAAPTATDNCTDAPTINMVSDVTTPEANCANAYVQVRTWNFTDGCGNTSNDFVQTITVIDNTAPVVDNTAGDLDVTLQCSDASGIADALAAAPTATDNCTDAPTINLVSDVTTPDANCANAYVQVRTWNFTDGCGNTSNDFVQTITVIDNTAPVVDNTAGDLDVTLQCSDASGIADALAAAPTATDNCTDAPTINLVSDVTTPDANCANAYVQVRTWNFTDGCGNTSNDFVQTITVIDNTAPVVDNTAGDLDVTLQCSDASGIADALAAAPTATDNCTDAPTINLVSDVTTPDANCANAYVQVRTWNFTDGCGNTSNDFVQTITVIDNTAPVVDNTAGDLDVTLQCSDASGIADALAAAPTATDNCTDAPTINLVSDVTTPDANCANAYVQVRTWNFTDGCGNTSNDFVQTITVIDNTAPVVDNTAGDLDVTLQCSDASGIADALAAAPTATDNCTDAPTINLVSDVTTPDANCANAYVQVRTWNFTDGCGNTSNDFVQTITVIDNTAPVVDNTAGDLDVTLQCSDASGIADALAAAPTATDNCTDAPTINLVSDVTTPDANCANAYVQVRTWNFTDGCGNTSNDFVQTITVIDNTAPVVDNTAGDLDVTLQCSDASGIADALAAAPTATDNCTDAPTINLVSDVTTPDANCANAYVQVRTWNFTDGCGNTSNDFVQTITVIDNTAPVVDNTAGDLDVTLQCSDASGIADALAAAPTATDNCTDAPTINLVSDVTTPDANCANAYVQVRTWNFTDGCGNTSNDFVQTITVIDNTAPVVDNTAGDLDVTLQCSDASGIADALAAAPTATDNCTDAPTINLVSDVTTPDANCANAYVQVRTWNFTDGCGNTSNDFVQTITVIDNTAPVVDNTAGDLDVTLQCSDASGIADALAAAPTATDNCTDAPTINLVSDVTTPDANCANAYVQVRTWNFTDGCGNTSNDFVQTITVIDNTAPVVDNTAGDLDVTLQCSDASGIADALAAAPTATDNCTDAPTINLVSDVTTPDANCANAYVQVRTWNFTDGCGNTSNDFVQTITVIDNTAPVVDNTAGDLDVTLQCSDASGIADALAAAPTATDNCTDAPTINLVSDVTTPDANCANAYVQVRTWNFTDGCGNTSNDFVQTITVIDNTAPVVDNTAGDLDVTLQCSDASGIADALAAAPTATDNCTDAPTINLVSDVTTPDANCANAYVQVRTWNFTDGCGNTSNDFVQTITVIDNTAPVVDNTAGDLDVTLQCSDASGIADALAAAPTATDNCTDAPTINLVSDVTTPDANCANAYVQVRTWNFTDGCGNTSNDFVQTITVIDNTAPVVDNTAGDLDVTLQCSDASGIADALAAAPTATDNCTDAPTINLVSDVTTPDANCANAYVQVRTWNFTDGCGNTSNDFVQTITVIDNTAPVVDNTAGDLDVTLQCSDASGIADALAAAPTATDNCTDAPTINLVSDVTTPDANCANAYVQVRTWNFTDGCGNTSNDFVQTITVIDNTAPVVDNTAGDLDVTLQCSDASGIADALAAAPTATDNCTDAPTINLVSDVTTPDANCANAYVQVRTWNFTDGCGNTSNDFVQTITVIDNTAPVVDNTAGDLDVTLQCSDASGIADALAAAPTATDNCTDAPTINLVSDVTTPDANCANAYVQVRTWNFTDGCGNTSNDFVQTITVIDNTAPVVDNTAGDLDVTLQCSDASGIADALAAAPTATDNCTDAPTINLVSDVTTPDANCANAYVQVRTWNFTDGCGNTSNDFVQTITVIDNTAPVVDNTAGDLDVTLQCSDASGIADALAAAPTATDNCTDAPTINLVSDVTTPDANCANAYVQVRTWNFTDGCGNTSNDFVQTITVIDNTAPVVDNTAGDLDVTLQCSDASGIADALAAAPTATDNCTDAPTINLVSDVTTPDANCANAYVQVRTWNFTDGCGNTSNDFVQTITVIDNTAPVVDNTAGDLDVTLQCSDASGIADALAAAPTATDNCTDAPTINLVSDVTTPDANCANAYVQVRTWNFTDGCGNTSNDFVQTITVIDNTAPVVDNTAGDLDVTLQCSDASGIADALAAAPTATDNCTDAPTINLVSDVTTPDANCANAYVQVRTWNFTDGCGNTSNDFVQTITVIDNTAPVVDNTAGDLDVTLQCSDASGIADALAAAPTATDNCTDAPTINLVSDVTTPDANCANAYVQVRTWNFTDGCGNTSNDFVQTITVIDNTAPVVDNTAGDLDVTLQCSDASGIADALAAAPTATDNCTDAPTINLVSDVTTPDANCANAYVQVRTWNFTDGCGNTSNDFVQTITVIDNTAPVVDNTNLTNINIECGIDPANKLSDWLANHAGATATDNCGDVTWSNNYGENQNIQCEGGAITVIYTATDACGNASTTSASYSIQDNTAPTFNETLPTTEITAECDAVVEADVLTASDNCDTDVPVVFTETKTDGDCANSYTLIRTWTATDNCGNETSHTQKVVVSDNTAPEVTCNDITVQLDANGAATITVDDINGGTTDACSDIDTMFISQATFDCDNVGENEVTLTVIDECGNASTCTATVTVEEGDADCGLQPFKANDDILTLVYCPDETISGELDLFANDEGFTPENVNFTILTDLPEGVSVTDGNLLYANEDPTEAVITFTYSICHTVNTENCSTAEVTIQLLVDTDCDDVPDIDDLDDDDDGILDIIEEENALDQTSLDSDGDGIVDRLDIDADNDGIVDNVEWQSTIDEGGEYDYIFPLGTDSNGNGWDDAYDPASNGITYEPWDMDLDGTPDYLDTNTDNEGEDDNVEGWDKFPNDSIADVSYIGNDADKDGLDDAYDTYNTTTEEWAPGQNAIGSDAYLQDTDDDGVRDWRDAVDNRTPPEQFACGDPVIPNAFSPNQDGYNDYFKVMIYCTGTQGGNEERVLGDDFSDARIEIFNRWGNLVYEQERYGNEDYWGDVDAWWNGRSTHNMQVGSDQLPTATYYYILYFNDGSREPITGFVFLNN